MRNSGILGLTLPVAFTIAFLGSAYGEEVGTSRQRFFGIGGWFHGKHCPGVELVWHSVHDRQLLSAFFRTRTGRKLRLGEGMAMFSPDCRFFWYTPYYGGGVSVFSTTSGKEVAFFSGLYPAWSPDSKFIYVSKPAAKKYQLRSWSVRGHKQTMIFEVEDACECIPAGDGVDWLPVEIEPNGDVTWTYPVRRRDAETGWVWTSGRVLTLDALTGKIKTVQSKGVGCLPEAENGEAPPAGAK